MARISPEGIDETKVANHGAVSAEGGGWRGGEGHALELKSKSFGGVGTMGVEVPLQLLRHCQTDVQDYYAEYAESLDSAMSTIADAPPSPEYDPPPAAPRASRTSHRNVTWADDHGNNLTQV